MAAQPRRRRGRAVARGLLGLHPERRLRRRARPRAAAGAGHRLHRDLADAESGRPPGDPRVGARAAAEAPRGDYGAARRRRNLATVLT